MITNLTPDQLYDISRLNTDDELKEYLAKAGVELNIKELEEVSGGRRLIEAPTGLKKKCPVCGALVSSDKYTLHIVLMHDGKVG